MVAGGGDDDDDDDDADASGCGGAPWPAAAAAAACVGDFLWANQFGAGSVQPTLVHKSLAISRVPAAACTALASPRPSRTAPFSLLKTCSPDRTSRRFSDTSKSVSCILSSMTWFGSTNAATAMLLPPSLRAPSSSSSTSKALKKWVGTATPGYSPMHCNSNSNSSKEPCEWVGE